MTEHDLMRALLRRINYRAHALVCPNVFLNGIREMDLAVVSRAGYLWEYEMKTSKADLQRQAMKSGTMASHSDVSRFWLVVPEEAASTALECWPQAGVLVYAQREGHDWGCHAHWSWIEFSEIARPKKLCPLPLRQTLREEIRRKISIRYCDALIACAGLLADNR